MFQVRNNPAARRRCLTSLLAVAASFVSIVGGLGLSSGVASTCQEPNVAAATPDCPAATSAGPSTEVIESAKRRAADIYAAFLRGRTNSLSVVIADSQLSMLTGEPVRTPSVEARERLLGSFRPFRQINSSFCGPAVVSSMLWYLNANRATGHPATEATLTGDPEHDQTLLGSREWLGSAANEGTFWGRKYVPDALNRQRGSNWYVASATATVNGSLDQSAAMRSIQYAIDRGFPVAVNVAYSAETFYPEGFMSGITYEHWAVIHGYYDRNGVRYVRLGEVYANAHLPYHPVQDVPWDVMWKAIEAWYGIVW